MKAAGQGSAVFAFDMRLCAYEPAGTVDVDPANRPIIDKITRHTLATGKFED
jgi:hypothetical protein